ncbi:low molecular weight protein tyrosine phosphatase family protein [Pseudoalteromonas ardens]|uniref:Phosphotyrosine protein phosphatase n=1 Tax=Pseudoalteromonas rubra TaxID=43658 RepID=A0A0L0ERG2_9GAMM|nr:phosphotyrosine protein phosphatase [Pseudoalteromonas sp. R96]KNC66999.1 phosphotyrosine protein phosphatase [Pseudoalteromonas rubra]MDK1311254.1 phosphotyrosine protein phosphatase [Pseudoalteromonas sp. R96]
MTNMLFVCSRNQWRSPTAEKIWRTHPTVRVRSAGTSPRARRTVTAKDLHWAEILFVMENKHKAQLKTRFAAALQHKEIHVLDVPDEYALMEPSLVELIQQSVSDYLDLV